MVGRVENGIHAALSEKIQCIHQIHPSLSTFFFFFTDTEKKRCTGGARYNVPLPHPRSQEGGGWSKDSPGHNTGNGVAKLVCRHCQGLDKG